MEKIVPSEAPDLGAAQPVGFSFWQILASIPICFFLRCLTSGPLFQVLPGRFFILFLILRYWAKKTSGLQLGIRPYVLAPAVISSVCGIIFSRVIILPVSMYFYQFAAIYIVAVMQGRVVKRSWWVVATVFILTYSFSYIFFHISMEEGVTGAIRYMRSGVLPSRTESMFSMVAVADALDLVTCLFGFMILCRRPKV